MCKFERVFSLDNPTNHGKSMRLQLLIFFTSLFLVSAAHAQIRVTSSSFGIGAIHVTDPVQGIRIYGKIDSLGHLQIDEQGRINNLGTILMTGDFIHNKVDNINGFLRDPANQQRGVLWMSPFPGNTTPQLIRGNTDPVFNNLRVTEGIKQLSGVDAFVDRLSTFTIDGSCEFKTSIHRMTMLNNNTKAIVAASASDFVSSDEADIPFVNSDKYVQGNAPPVGSTYGGRLVWYTINRTDSVYLFPVGSSGLTPNKREVILTGLTATDSLGRLDSVRKYMVRLVAAKPDEDNLWLLGEDNNTPGGLSFDVCKLNDNFFHIIDDSTVHDSGVVGANLRRGKPMPVTSLEIRYYASDGDFDGLSQYFRGQEVVEKEGWTDLDVTLDESAEPFRAIKKDNAKWFYRWDYPLFALSLERPKKGLRTDPLATRIITDESRVPSEIHVFPNGQSLPQQGTYVDFITNPENDQRKYNWDWTVNELLRSRLTRVLGLNGPGEDTLKIGFGETIKEGSDRPIGPGYYDIDVKISNLAEPEGCFVRDTIRVLITPDRAAYIPDAFTPGAGTNSEFIGYFYGFKWMEVEIWNRWGQLIHRKRQEGMLTDVNMNEYFSVEGPEPVVLWDGREQGGKYVQESVYVYVIKMETTEDPISKTRIWQKQGTVTVVY
jgi:hypothetical protein